MRIQRHPRTVLAFACWLATGAAAARADVDVGPGLLSGWVETGGRLVTGDDDSGKFEEYRDVGEGLFGGGSLMLQPDRRHYLRVGGFDVGEEDADYFLEGGRGGRWNLFGSYSQIPHNYSNDALTPYLGIAGGDLVLPFAPPTDTATFESSVAGAAHDAKLGFDTDTAIVGARFEPTADSSVRAAYRAIRRDG